MDTETTMTTTSAETEPPCDPKTATKQRKIKTPATKNVVRPRPVKAKQAEAPKTEKAPAEPRVNEHVAAGLDVNLYTGLSKFVNANRKVGVRQDVVATTDDMTTRMQQGLYALRKAYGERAWKARGFDNGILAHLAAAGLIAFSGGHVQMVDGHPKLTDGETPVTAKITKLGMKYGVA